MAWATWMLGVDPVTAVGRITEEHRRRLLAAQGMDPLLARPPWARGHDERGPVDGHRIYWALRCRLAVVVDLLAGLEASMRHARPTTIAALFMAVGPGTSGTPVTIDNYERLETMDALVRFHDSHGPTVQRCSEWPADSPSPPPDEWFSTGTMWTSPPTYWGHRERWTVLNHPDWVTWHDEWQPSPADVAAIGHPDRCHDLWCTFTATVQWLEHHDERLAAPATWTYWHPATVSWFYDGQAGTIKPGGHRMVALMWRLHWGHELLAGAVTAGDGPLALALQLYIDTHLPLVAHVEADPVNHLLSTPDCGWQHYPWPYRAEHAGDLPALTKSFNYVSFVRDRGESGNGAWSTIIRKLGVRVCQSRSFDVIHARSCTESAAFTAWWLACLRATVLGLYEHCGHRPSVSRRMAFQHWLAATSTDQLLAWQRANPVVTVCAEREFFVTQLRDVRALWDVTVRHYPDWLKFEARVLAKCDALRRRFSETGSLWQAGLATEEIGGQYRVYRWPESLPTKRLCDEISTDDDTVLDADLSAAISGCIASTVPGDPIQPALLRSTLTPTGSVAVRQMLATGSRGDVFDKLSATDRAVTRALLGDWRHHDELRSVALVDRQLYAEQMHALHRYHSCGNKRLPAHTTVLAVSPCCRRLRTYLPRERPGPAYGYHKAFWDVDLQLAVCGGVDKGRTCTATDTPLHTVPLIGRIVAVHGYKRLPAAEHATAAGNGAGSGGSRARGVIRRRAAKAGTVVAPATVQDATVRSASTTVVGPFWICPSCGQCAPFTMAGWSAMGWSCGQCGRLPALTDQLPWCVGCDGASVASRRQRDMHRLFAMDDRPNVGDFRCDWVAVCGDCWRPWIAHLSRPVRLGELVPAIRQYSAERGDELSQWFME